MMLIKLALTQLIRIIYKFYDNVLEYIVQTRQMVSVINFKEKFKENLQLV